MHSGRIVLFALAAVTSLVMVGCTNSRGPTTEPSRAASGTADFGGELSLTGYAIQDKNGHPEVELRWKALRKPSADYYVFVHVLDGSGEMVFQLDHPLKNPAGSVTGAWSAVESVIDRFLAAPPPGRRTGTYTLRIGLYIAQPMKVLQVTGAAFRQPADGWKNQSILIERVDCK